METTNYYDRSLGENINGKYYLVTGGSGFIGSTLVDALLNSGAYVRVLDNFSTGNIKNLTNAILTHRDRLKLIDGDIRDPHTCEVATGSWDGHKLDGVFHEAALVSVPKSNTDPLLNNNINVDGFVNILKGCKVNQVERLVYASSAAVYGDVDIFPTPEIAKTIPTSPYGLSKLQDEQYASILGKITDSIGVENEWTKNEITTVGLRYFNVFGPRQDPKSPYSGVISIFIDRMLEGKDGSEFGPKIEGNGKNIRDFVFVKNIVQANIRAMIVDKNRLTGVSKSQGPVFNVGTGIATHIGDLFNTLANIIGFTQTTNKAPTWNNIENRITHLNENNSQLMVRSKKKIIKLMQIKPKNNYLIYLVFGIPPDRTILRNL